MKLNLHIKPAFWLALLLIYSMWWFPTQVFVWVTGYQLPIELAKHYLDYMLALMAGPVVAHVLVSHNNSKRGKDDAADSGNSRVP